MRPLSLKDVSKINTSPFFSEQRTDLAAEHEFDVVVESFIALADQLGC